MAKDKEADKTRRIKNAHSILSADVGAGADAARLCDMMFARAEAEDIICYEPVELAALARDAFKHAMAHKPGGHTIRIGSSTVSADHRRDQIMVIEIANDNMPFLVDSVMGELRDLGCTVRLVVHPILTVERNRNGRITRMLTDSAAGTAEKSSRLSLIHIHIDPVEHDEDRAKIEAAINSLLVTVRTVVDDWTPMMTRINRAIEEFQQSPPPIPVDEIAEAVQFLQWLVDANFTFLGVREYTFTGGAKRGSLKPIEKPGLGLLRDPDMHVLRRGAELATMTPEVREFLMQPQPLIITKANVKSRVHRRVHMDYIGVKQYDEHGKLTGELRLIGLFTSTAYTRSVKYIPYLRRKVDVVIRRAALEPQSHSGKALLNVLENYPRDELFQIDEGLLFLFANAIHHLDERPRVRVLVRSDKFERFVSILVFVPRDRYSTSIREAIGDYLTDSFKGRLSAWYVTYPEGPLARVHFIIGRFTGKTPNPNPETLERTIARIVRTWFDALADNLVENHDQTRARLLAERYENAFSAAYKEAYDPTTAVADVAIAESEMGAEDVTIDFYNRDYFGPKQIALKVYHRARPIPLSERVPVLENMGFRVVNERTYSIKPA
ncbi:MAG: NAD-glutamate dehydrogenase, partial [Hyphomicrobiales bacterium]|nr:NAD-glutamate dehydrogenase [Hyphomicrobiales bacterium]